MNFDFNSGKFKSELQIFKEYLKTNTVSSTMAFEATGIPQKHLTWYKKILEEAGELKVAFLALCKSTGKLVQYLTTDPDKFPPKRQLSMFDDDEAA